MRGATALRSTDGVFAANRVASRIVFEAKAAAGATRRARVQEQGALRVRCPGPPSPELEAVIVNTAGGMAGGDRFDLDIVAGPGARLVVTTAAAEKVYRALDADTGVAVRLAAGAASHLAWLPRETILFDRARLRRTIEVDLAPNARLLLAEAIVFGRGGMGEEVREGLLFDRWRIRREGKLIYAETVRIDDAVADKLRRPAAANGGNAVATVLCVPGDDAMIAAVRAFDGRWRGEVGASAWNGLAAVRLVAADGAALRHDLVTVLMAIRGQSLPRLWLN